MGNRAAASEVMRALGDEGRVDVARARVHVHEDRDRPFVEDAIRGSDERERRGDDEIALAHPGGDSAQVQAARARVDADAVRDAHVIRAGFLERLNLRADAERGRVQDTIDCRDLGFGEIGRRHGDVHFFFHEGTRRVTKARGVDAPFVERCDGREEDRFALVTIGGEFYLRSLNWKLKADSRRRQPAQQSFYT